MKRNGYDQKCQDLAEYFLPNASAERLVRLAQHIQDEIEDWIESERAELELQIARKRGLQRLT